MLRQALHLMRGAARLRARSSRWAAPPPPSPGRPRGSRRGQHRGAGDGRTSPGAGRSAPHPPSFCLIPFSGARRAAPHPRQPPRARSGSPARARGARRRLTVSVLAVDPVDAAVGQDLDVEADAHVAVEAPQPLDAQEVVAVAGGVAALGREARHGAGEERRVPAALAGPGGEAARGRPAAHRPRPQQPQEQRRQQRRGERHPGEGRAATGRRPVVAPKRRSPPQLPLYAEVGARGGGGVVCVCEECAGRGG